MNSLGLRKSEKLAYLRMARKKIKPLQKLEDNIYQGALAALDAGDDPHSHVFDYLFNGGKAEDAMKGLEYERAKESSGRPDEGTDQTLCRP